MPDEIPFFGSYSPVSIEAATNTHAALAALCAQPLVRALLQEHHPALLAQAEAAAGELKEALDNARAVGVTKVEVGTSRSLDEPGPLVIRVAFEDDGPRGRREHHYLGLPDEPDTLTDPGEPERPGGSDYAHRVGGLADIYGHDHYGNPVDRGDHRMVLGDLLADLLHLARRRGLEPLDLLGQAALRFSEEEAGHDLDPDETLDLANSLTRAVMRVPF
jgi:hypothetical protein